MKSAQIRQTFLDFFRDREHAVVPSSSLVPHGDPTLLFTNAGMNQFKNVFLGMEKRDYSRAVSCQKCVRAGGKHNDLENVGKTARHHTFFEMLGNFSFGDYFKKDATAWAWDLVTRGLKMDPEHLWISIHYSDNEAFDLWHKNVGVRAERIVRLGDKDNFWAMGDTGPCGPCSEIYYDQGPGFGCGRKECSIECDCGRYTEFWNLVFMQYNRDEKGELIALPRPSIDTGLGLERTTALIQGVSSNFETDHIFPLITHAAAAAGVKWNASDRTDVALKVLADHARAATFLIAEGVTPSNEGRGYVLRRIVRRALRYGRVLAFRDAFLYGLTGKVIDLMSGVYPELEASRDYVASVCKSEEEKFKSVVENATDQLEGIYERAARENRTVLLGTEVFKLYDTFGLPVDFVQEWANERNFEVDLAGFEEQMERQRQTARAASKFETSEAQDLYRQVGRSIQTVFTGYGTLEEKDCEVLSLLVDYKSAARISAGETAEVILNKTPFYAESGGQMGDRGVFITGSGRASVLDTQVPVPGLIVHRVRMDEGSLEKGVLVTARVDPAFRQSVRKNHTATHLLHAALRRHLGDHVKQSGSLVAPDRLRFDFTHYSGLKADEVRNLEQQVNEKVLSNIVVKTKETSMEQAVAEGAMALFGEKYGDQVRMVTIGDYSKELCGGTHCGSTGEVGAFLILRESSTAAGIRRIEAVTGTGALETVQNERALLHNLTSALKVSPDELAERIQHLLEHNRKLEKEVERLKKQAMMGVDSPDLSAEISIPGGKAYLRVFPEADADQLGGFVDEKASAGHYRLVVSGSVSGGFVAIRASEGEDATAFLKKVLAPEFGGGGGGRKDFAKGGLKKLKDLSPNEAFETMKRLLENYQRAGS